MTFVTFATANNICDRFLSLLDRYGIHPPSASKIEGELLSVTELLELWDNPANYASGQQIETLRAAAGIHDFAAKVLSTETLPDFPNFLPHLRLIGETKFPAASLGQNSGSAQSDDTSRKIAELYMACLAAHTGTEVELDAPSGGKGGDNPDVIFRPAVDPTRRWALAIKTISTSSGQTIFERVADGARQIDRQSCPADFGLVVINTKSALDHEALWNANFLTEEEAKDAVTAQVTSLIDAMEVNRPDAEWDAVFAARTSRPLLFLAQALVSLPTPIGRTPTAIKILIAHDFKGDVLDPTAYALATTMNMWMQTILLGIAPVDCTLPR